MFLFKVQKIAKVQGITVKERQDERRNELKGIEANELQWNGAQH
ncbi:hypothetical protein M621_18810 [Serratia plymuthica S13]|uniref:Uncharacterized protein n=1 Tax=Serratia plymuthica S13 TaxID=1348660 RepID=S4YPM0_SERPL|nr:hypothetical protein M621_18810 [Serratia plymuthica S13]